LRLKTSIAKGSYYLTRGIIPQRDLQLLLVLRRPTGVRGGIERLFNDLGRSLEKNCHIDYVRPLKNYPRKIGLLSSLLRSILSLLWKKYDLVIGQDLSLSILGPFCRMFGIRLIIFAHGLDVVYPSSVYRRYVLFFSKYASKIICVSKSTFDECSSLGIPHDKLLVVNNGVDFERWENLDKNETDLKNLNKVLQNRQYILSVGRLIERKGFHWFIMNAMPYLCEIYPDLRYVIIGEGPLKEMIENTIIKMNLVDKIILLGEVPDSILAWAYRNAAVLVSPNIPVSGDKEGFGLCNIEAPFFGTPVIASRIDGIPDAITEGITGFLVEPLNPDDFIHKISIILSGTYQFDKKVMREYVVNKFSSAKTAKLILNLIKDPK